MNRMLLIAGVATAACVLGGCATVVRGTNQDFIIDSEPGATAVTLSNGMACVTPCKLHLKRKHEFTASFAKEGYEPAEVSVESKFSGGGGAAGAGNLLLGGFIGAGVDASNGSLNSLFPQPLIVRLAPLGSGEAAMLLGKDKQTISTVEAYNAAIIAKRNGSAPKPAAK